MTERGVPVDHTTICRWVQKYTLELDKQTRWYRQVKYLNNILEGDHGRLKRILGPKGMEAMYSLRKGHGVMFAYGQPTPDAGIVNRVFETA